MISCEQAAIICNKTQYREASLHEKLFLRLHIVLCRTCNSYVRKNTKFTSLCGKAGLRGLTEAEKQEMRERITTHKS